jgi:DNA-directed RNA polymerase subunit RPC12/RpoP
MAGAFVCLYYKTLISAKRRLIMKKLKDLRGLFHDKCLEEISVNPLVIAEDQAFNQTVSGDYREQALKKVVGLKLPFNSTYNSVFNLFRKLVSVKCPYCSGKTKFRSGGGAGDSYHMQYVCEKCKAEVSITVSHDAFHAHPD